MPTGSENGHGRALALDARGLGKTYQLGQLQDVQRAAGRLLRRGQQPPPRKPFMALDDVSFQVARGDGFAMLGSNGSGKSTLVQIMSGISVPTEGSLTVRGRVLPLLEVGAGFHPELTGRENVTLFGTILGLSDEEIESAMPHISQFGGIDEEHMDTPIKRFSMGMQARLSFAVAMRFPADIYIFDEVMAVVDDHFRGVAMSEIKHLMERGKTVVFISHDLDLVRELCSHGIWLDGGKLRMSGPIDGLAEAYRRFQLAGLDSEEAEAAQV
ncbi:MAG: ABC transporter ATP-binding protein [Thermoleophilaceae bacterium]